jgi:hypothetical protein
MNTKGYIRISLVILVLSISMVLFAYSHKRVSQTQGSPDGCGKCEREKPQSEFILWETLSHNLFFANR